MGKKRKIAVVTGSRAEYGLLYWLMKEIDQDKNLILEIYVTGMHLSPEFGLTYRQIEDDGFKITAKVEMLLSIDTPSGISKSIGLGIIGFSDAFKLHEPDIIVLLGDRYEILSAAIAAMTARIPIAHIHGGESSEMAIDESIRHAITKMSHLHFVANDLYANRITQMGEFRQHIFNFGAPGLDHITRSSLLEKTVIENKLDINLDALTFLVTYHPESLQSQGPMLAVQNLLSALDYFPEAQIIFTQSNADTEGRVITDLIKSYLERNPSRGKLFTSLGSINYLSLLKYVHLVIGNSSSGIIEVPYFKIPTINIGDRQLGRLQASSIINTSNECISIKSAIEKALSNEFKNKIKSIKYPYGNGNASFKIKNVLKSVELERLVYKRFYSMSDEALA